MLLRRLDAGEGLAGRHGALAQDLRLRPGEVDYRGRPSRELSPVDDRTAAGADLLGHLVEAARIGAAVKVRARRSHAAELCDHLGRLAWQLREADATRVGRGDR